MNQLKILYPYVLLILLIACTTSNSEIEIHIQKYYKNINTLGPNETLHKDKDVEILRIPILEFDKSINLTEPNKTLNEDLLYRIVVSNSENENIIFYSCIIYRIDKGKLKGYQTHMSFLNNYNKATFQWVNDSTVTVSFNNKFHISKKFTIMGYGNTTLLGWVD